MQSVRRERVTFNQVAYPVMVLFAVAVIILIAWTILDGEQWDRDVVNEVTGESYGKCSAKGPVSLIMIMMWELYWCLGMFN